MRVVVVGATGVLGTRIVPRLIAQGHTVTAVGRSAAPLQALASMGAAVVQADLFDAAAMRQAMAGHQAVVNVATAVPRTSRTFVPGAWKAMDHVRRQGSAVVADAAIANGLERVVQESFAPIYPDCGSEWITETTTPTPARYDRSAIDAEASAMRLAAAGGTAVVLRYGLLYGPGDALAEQLVAFTRKGWMPLPGRRDGFLCMVTQDDAAAATVAALTVPTGTYNVVDDEPLTRQEVGSSLAAMLGVKPPHFLPPWVARLGGSVGETLARSLRVSNRKLRQASAWAPVTGNARDGLRLEVERERRAQAA